MSTLSELRDELLEWQSKETDAQLKRDSVIQNLDLLCTDKSLPVIGGQGNWFNAMRWLPQAPSPSFSIENVTNVVRKETANGSPVSYLQACGGDTGEAFQQVFLQAAGNTQSFEFMGQTFPTEATGVVLTTLNKNWTTLVKALQEQVLNLVKIRSEIKRLQDAITQVTTDVVVGNVAGQVQSAVIQQAINSVTQSFKNNKSTYTLIAVLVVSLLVFNLVKKRKSNA